MMYELTTRTFVCHDTCMDKYITYLRVSTKKQGVSGLGLEAQRESVKQFAGARTIVQEYVEVESGKNNRRPQLMQALAHARKAKAILLIAKLDRLSRNVAFVANLLDAKIKFVAVDMPEADETMLLMRSVFAQWERKQASERTKAALAAAKARGVKLGGDVAKAAIANHKAALEANREAREVAGRLYEEEGLTLAEIGIELQKSGILTRTGRVVWSPTQVRRLLK